MVLADPTSHTPVTSSFGCRCCAGSQSFQGFAATNHFRERLLEIQVIFFFFLFFFFFLLLTICIYFKRRLNLYTLAKSRVYIVFSLCKF